MNIIRRMAAGCAMLALVGSLPAQATCWADHERDAAGVRELQTMLMVASLRCHAMGIDIVGDYNGFMQASRGEIEAANLTIKTHFAGEGGGQADYDRFTTRLANGYGDAATDAASCAEAAGIAHDAAASRDQLRRIATYRIFPRALPGGTCSAPAKAEPVTIAAPVMRPAIVALPDDVVAALTVMARYGRPAVSTPTPPPAQLAALGH